MACVHALWTRLKIVSATMTKSKFEMTCGSLQNTGKKGFVGVPGRRDGIDVIPVGTVQGADLT